MPVLERDRASLYYETAGEAGPPVLLVQGCGVAGEGWRPQVEALAKSHRVVIFDHRGIGKSTLTGEVSIAAMAADVGRLFGRDLADQPSINMKQVRALGAHDASEKLGALSSIPTLVVSATEDRIAPRTQGKALAEAIRGALYVEIEGAAHAVTIQKADEINALLVTHIDDAERVRTAA